MHGFGLLLHFDIHILPFLRNISTLRPSYKMNGFSIGKVFLSIYLWYNILSGYSGIKPQEEEIRD